MQSFANIESLIGLTSDRPTDRRPFHDLPLFQPPSGLVQPSSAIDVDNFSQPRSTSSSAQHTSDANKVDFSASSANHSINNSNGTRDYLLFELCPDQRWWWRRRRA